MIDQPTPIPTPSPENPPPKKSLSPLSRALAFIVVLALLSLLGWGLVRAEQGQVSSGQAPDFSLTNFEGETIRLSDLRGKVVIINFWASWCLPCREEMPLFEQFYSRQKYELTILGVDLGEDRATVQAFIDELGITFPILLDQDQAVTQTYRVYGIPTSFFLDKNGVIRDVVIGRVPDEEALKARLEGILPAQ